MKSIQCTVLLSLFVALAMFGCSGDENVTQITEIVTGPVVTGVNPQAGPPAGGTVITLSGSNFVAGALVDIGGSQATSVTIDSDSQITATTPAGTVGPAIITVQNPDMRTGSLIIGFTYADPPTLTSVSPSIGTSQGGTTVTLTGTGFKPGTWVDFGTGPATSMTYFSSTQITAVTPPQTGGTVDVVVINPNGQSTTLAASFTFNAPPSIATSLLADTTLFVGKTVNFTVTVTDPEGDNVNLNLLNPPTGCLFTPVIAGASPATVNVQWIVSSTPGGYRILMFEASDMVFPTIRVPAALPVQVLGSVKSSGLITADVTGDGVLDTIGLARDADVSETSNTGAIYVWAGSPAPSSTPTATLTVSTAVADDQLGNIGNAQGILCADVTGDGILDIVAGAYLADTGVITDTGAIYVWAGGLGLTGSQSPTATLAVTGAIANDRLGYINAGQGILCTDVTGDGTLDIVAGAYDADTGVIMNTGAIYVWAGGSGLTDSQAPTATLTVSGAVASDRLGHINGGQGILCADVTGDGTLDIVAGACNADAGALLNTGAIYVWAGGSGLTGSPAPTATLTVTGAVANDQLGAGVGQGILCADVTGDGTLDIVAGAANADTGPVTDTGAIYVWAGGLGLTGSQAPTATLAVTGAVAQDRLGSIGGQGILCQDVTGDGTIDIVAGAMYADTGVVTDTGAIYVWAGGSGLTGSQAPTATLTVTGALAGDNLGFTSGQGVLCVDITGDSTLDIVAGAMYADTGAISCTGAIYVWAGGTGLTGSPAQTATLTVAGAVALDFLSHIGVGQGILFTDVTGDGTLDIVAGAICADIGAASEAGAIYVWAGDSGFTGSQTETATLTVPGAATMDRMCYIWYGQGLLCTDVTGDGIIDIVAGAFSAEAGAVSDTGAIYVWAGGSGLTGSLAPTATLTITSAAAFDRLGTIGSAQGILCEDVTGDGIIDIVAGASYSDTAGVADTGAIYVWAGGSGLAGAPTPRITLTVTGAAVNDQLGAGVGQGIRCVDVTGDGFLDILAGACYADTGGVTDAGAIYLWTGVPGLTGNQPPSATMIVPNAVTGDKLGQ